ncbi:MAG: PAS domain S-box protein [Deltaproteobacteria bacterium]|nr:PAS domain S-box protein [Deltaproteobacteria bacterium]
MVDIDKTMDQKAKPRILIVEDEVIIASDLESQLKEFGFTVLGMATSAEATLDLIDQEQPDLVLMDIVLGGKMDGIGAATIIKDKWGIPVVFLTAYAEQAKLEQAKLTLPFGYILKPFKGRDLKVAIEMALYVAKVDAERRKEKEKLTEQERYLRTILETTKDGCCVVNTKGKITDANKSYCEMSGYSREDLLQLSLEEIDVDETPEEIVARIERIIQNGEEFFEARHRRKDGSVFDVEITVSYLDSEGGRFVCFYRDITDRKKAERCLRESEARFRLIYEHMKVGVAQISLTFRIESANNAFCRMLGYREEELIGNHLRDITHPESIEENLRQQARLASGQIDSYHMEKKYIHKKGHTICCIIDTNLIRDDNDQPLYCLGTVMDITERKRTEGELRSALQRLKFHNENSPLAIVEFDPGFRIIFWSHQAEALFGWNSDEILGKRIDQLKWVHEDDAQRVAAISADMMAGKQTCNLHTNRNYRKDGSVIICEWYNSAMLNSEGRLVSVFSQVLDITARKQAEEEKEKLQSQLLQAQKMESVGILAGGIAHDFNNLLQVINGFTQILLMDKGRHDHDYTSLQNIFKAGNRAADLVRQLLLFSRKVETKRVIIRLNQEIENARKMLERIIPKMIDIELHPGRGLWDVKADHGQIDQILLNLGKNAADAMPDGGKFIIATENITLDQGYVQAHLGVKPGRYVLLTVSDTGHGMEQETIEHIFDPFFTTKEIGKGTGLGLASVYGIVKSHDGYINCHSEIGRGTSFKIYLPAIESEDIAGSKDTNTRPFQGGSETILLVDDEELIRGFAQQVLLKFGYKVLTASSGEEALGIYSGKHSMIDLVIMDIGMPGMGGHKCLTEIMRLNPSAKILIGSGYSANGQVKETLEAGAAGYVGKPYELTDLLNKVRAVLDGEVDL